MKGGGKIEKRKLLRSVIHSICSSLSDDNIINCNRLFWQNNNVSGGSDGARVWDIAKALGVTFSGDEEGIIKELEILERRDRKQGKMSVGVCKVSHENN